MLFSIAHFLVGRILRFGRPPDEGREIELLVLRHQVKVLQRHVKREGFIYSDPAPDMRFLGRWPAVFGKAGETLAQVGVL